MKVFKNIIIGLIVVILIGALLFQLMSIRIVNQAQTLALVDLDPGQLDDGVYRGSYEISPVKVDLETHIVDGKIDEIVILDHFHGRGYSAQSITDDIIDAKSLDVDNISGATVSSICIKKAVEDSLNMDHKDHPNFSGCKDEISLSK